MQPPPKPQTGKNRQSIFKRAYKSFYHFYLRYLFKRDTILATISVFIFIGLLSLLPLNTSILNPFKTALKDLDFNDIAYSSLKKNENSSIDNRIVILNIGDADRAAIAQIIEKLRITKPKVIGLDVLFNGPREAESDSVLRHMIGSTPNLIVVSRIDWTNKAVPEDVGYFGIYTPNRGYANFIGEDGGTIRTFSPFEKIKNKQLTSFPVALVKSYDNKAFLKLQKRKRDYEIINYSRKIDQYMMIDASDLLADNVSPEIFTNKIVLVGYINPDPSYVDDKHFTPLNKEFVGRSVPDMNGIVIHANIISMILDGNYIRDIPSGIFWVITILIAWLHVALFMRYYIEDHIWFHLVAKVAQIIFAILSVYIGIVFFDWFHLKIDTKISLIVIILAIDIIYFYEALAVWLHTKFGFQTSFHSKSH